MTTTRLLDPEWRRICAAGPLLFARRGAVLAQRINLETLQAVGEPLPVTDRSQLRRDRRERRAVGRGGRNHRLSRRSGDRQLRWVEGRAPIAVLAGPDSGEPEPRASPDGPRSRSRMVNGNSDVWLIETARDVRQRFTSNPAREYNPSGLPKGAASFFGSTRKGVVDLYERSVGGAVTRRWCGSLPKARTRRLVAQTASGSCLRCRVPRRQRSLGAPRGREEADRRRAHRGRRTLAQFSPDGRWVAYQSNETDGTKVYVQPFPGPGSRTDLHQRWHVFQVAP